MYLGQSRTPVPTNCNLPYENAPNKGAFFIRLFSTFIFHNLSNMHQNYWK